MLKKRILVTGSSGFVGRIFLKKYRSSFKVKTFSFTREELNNINLNNIDVILHLSALVHQKKKLSLEEYLKVNAFQTFDLAKKAKKSKVKHFIFLSSISVYDKSLSHINEKSYLNPITFYGKSKLRGEQLIKSLEDNRFQITIIRSPLIYGMDCPGNISSLVKLIDWLPVIPLGGIDNKKSFVYVENLCSMIFGSIEKNKSGIFLASDDQVISTSYLVKTMARLKRKKIIVIKSTVFNFFLKYFFPNLYHKLFRNLTIDNNYTKSELNITNQIPFEEGIRKTLLNVDFDSNN